MFIEGLDSFSFFFFSFVIQTLFTNYCHVRNVIFVFKLQNWTDMSAIFCMLFLFDVRNLILGYLIYVFEMCIIRWAIYTYQWMCVLV